MVDDFKRPFTSPPTIFSVLLLIGIVVDFFYPIPLLNIWLQLPIGIVLVVSGVLLIRSSMQNIEEAGTTYDPYAASTELVTTGIYRRTRNPGYLGLAVIHIGFAFLLDSPWVAGTAVVAIVATSVAVIRLEEEKLTRTFGDAYRDYCSRVRRWI